MTAALKRARRHGVKAKADAIIAALPAEHLAQPPTLTAAYAATVRSLIAVISTLKKQVKTLDRQVREHLAGTRL